MDRIEKFIRKLSQSQRAQVVSIIDQIKNGDISGLDIKKLHGREQEFRVRKGAMHILCKRTDSGFDVTDIQWRGSKTY